MKAIQLTRKIKEQLSAHFSKGGTVDNVAGDLARVSLSERQQCFKYWEKHHKRSA